MTPEIGQILHNNPAGMAASDFTCALISAIRDGLARAYWNTQQKPWKGDDEESAWFGQFGQSDSLSYGPLPPGMEWRGYYNWGGCPGDPDWDQAEADRPNFSFEGVEVRWYKHFGRSMNVNVCWSADKWQRWFERAVQTIRAWEGRGVGWLSGDIEPYPEPKDAVPLDLTPDDLRYIELESKVETLEAQINLIACVCIDVSNGKQPELKPDDWRWCRIVEWVTKLGIHALAAPGKYTWSGK